MTVHHFQLLHSYQLPGQNLSSSIDIKFIFKNNSADVAGSVLYGGAITWPGLTQLCEDNCKLTDLDSNSFGKVFDMLVHIDYDNTNSEISSDPLRIIFAHVKTIFQTVVSPRMMFHMQ